MGAFIFLVAGVASLNVYALALVLVRAPIFGTRVYRPMLVNIAISLSPAIALVVALLALLAVTRAGSTFGLWLVIVVGMPIWLLLLPNSAYLITELNFSHRRTYETVPLWFDIVLVLTLALSGVMNTLINLALAQTIAVLVIFPGEEDPMRHPLPWVIVAGVLVLVGFGMYLGRYLRFNSWDLKLPRRFVTEFAEHFSRQGKVAEAAGFTVTHAILLAILYLFVIAPVIPTLST